MSAASARQELFRECHGRSGLRLIVEVPGEAHPRQISLDQPYLLIGGDSACDIVIRHPNIAARHLYLQWIDGRIYGCRLSSSKQGQAAGGWIGRKPVKLGSLRISIPDDEGQPVDFDPQARSAELAAEVPQVQLRFAGVEQRDNVWPVDRRLTLIGRGSDCRLRLDHVQISSVHASLIRTPSSCWLINLSGSGRVRVNDDSASPLKSLDIGDLLHLGPFTAEVSTAPYSLKSPRPAPPNESRTLAVRKLATQHRRRLGTLNKSLEAVKQFLDAEHANVVPDLKIALQRYVAQAQKHHREMQEALEQLSSPAETT